MKSETFDWKCSMLDSCIVLFPGNHDEIYRNATWKMHSLPCLFALSFCLFFLLSLFPLPSCGSLEFLFTLKLCRILSTGHSIDFLNLSTSPPPPLFFYTHHDIFKLILTYALSIHKNINLQFWSLLFFRLCVTWASITRCTSLCTITPAESAAESIK